MLEKLASVKRSLSHESCQQDFSQVVIQVILSLRLAHQAVKSLVEFVCFSGVSFKTFKIVFEIQLGTSNNLIQISNMLKLPA